MAISYGTEDVFESASTTNTNVAWLDSTHIVVAYRDGGNSYYGTAIVGVVSGTGITSWGSPNVFNAANTDFMSVAALDSTHFVVSYIDIGNSYYGTARVGVTSGSTISSYGAENVFNSTFASPTSVVKIDSTHFVVAYGKNNTSGEAIIGVTSGTTISSYGSASEFNSGKCKFLNIDLLDSTHFVIIYKDGGNLSYGTAIVGAFSGTTISSYGGENVFNADYTNFMSVAVLDSTHFVVVFEDNSNSNYGTARVGVTSGTTISSYGSNNVYANVYSTFVSVTALDSTNFIVAYNIGETTGDSRIGIVSGTTISSYEDVVSFASARTTNISIKSLDSTTVAISYQDYDNSFYGTAIIGSTASAGPAFASLNGVLTANIASINGVAIASVASVNEQV